MSICKAWLKGIMHKPAQKNREDCLKVYLICLQCVIKLYIFLIHIICRINGNVKLKVNCSLVHADNIFSGFHSSIISKLRTNTHWSHSFLHLRLSLSSSIYSYRLSVTLEFRMLRVRFRLKSHKILKLNSALSFNSWARSKLFQYWENSGKLWYGKVGLKWN